MSFEVNRPTTLEEALKILEEHGEDARVIAGGTDLVLAIRGGALSPRVVVDITRIPELRILEVNEDSIRIGAAVTIAELLEVEAIREGLPALWEAMYWLGSPQIRNVATLAGNLCNASPAADTAPPLLVYDAEVVAVGPNGERRFPIERLFAGVKRTTLESTEILKEVVVPLKRGFRSAFRKLGKRHAMILAIVSAAVGFSMEDGKMKGVRIALGSAAPTPFRAKGAEGVLEGKEPTPELVEEAAARARDETSPITDVRASAEYRREMSFVFVRRLIMELLGWS